MMSSGVKILSSTEVRAQLGLGKDAFRTKLERGEINKVDHNSYVIGCPTADHMARALATTRPTWVLTGISAYQFHQQVPLTFPLEYRAPRGATRAKSTKLLKVIPRRNTVAVNYSALQVVPPVVAMWDALDRLSHEQAVHFLEEHYRTKEGKANLELHLSWMGTVPKGLRSFVAETSIGSDSLVERRLFHGMRRRGLRFEQNVLLLGYLWDFHSLDEKRLLVEVGAHKYHRDLSSLEGERNYVRESWKLNQATLEGYIVLQFTAKCVDEELERCLDMIEDALEVLSGGTPRREWPQVWQWHDFLRRTQRWRAA